MRWLRIFSKEKYVGIDKLGNKYYTYQENTEIKRKVIFKEDVSSSNIPSLWRLWLYYKRDHPPSQDELLKDEERLRILREKVAELEESDRKLRLQEIAERQGRASKTLGTNLNDMLYQLTGKTSEASINTSHNSSLLNANRSQLPRSSNPSISKEEEKEDDIEPWKPPS